MMEQGRDREASGSKGEVKDKEFDKIGRNDQKERGLGVR